MSVAGSIVATGAISGDASAAALPTIDVPSHVKLKAQGGNSGSVFIGLNSSVTVPSDSTTDTTSGYELDAGQEITLVVGNLNELYLICDNAGDDLTYMVFGG